MKRRLALLVLASVLAPLAACHKNAAAHYFLSASINGVPFTVSSISYSQYGSSGHNTVISGTSSGRQLVLYLSGFDGTPGTLPVGTLAFADIEDSASYSIAYTGAIKITTVSPVISGTFYFTCTDSTKVTNGAFSTSTQ